MKKSGLIAVSLVIALPLLTACGAGMGTGAVSTSNGTSDELNLEELSGTISALEAKVAYQEREIEILQDILSIVSEHLLTAEENLADHAGRLTTAEGNIAAIQSNNTLMLDPYLTISSGTVNGLAGPHVILTGANLHIHNGTGATYPTINGLGNLLVGYNEIPVTGLNPGDRGGSHNLIVGPQHKYLSYGGLLAGFRNTVNGGDSSVSGGMDNTADGFVSSVSGGDSNTASGQYSNVSGGMDNIASGNYSSISGGSNNTASGIISSISGGAWNTASKDLSSVSGGWSNTASGTASSVSGGAFNEANGNNSSVSGGYDNEASGSNSSVSGGALNEASSISSSISGGYDNEASGNYAGVSGGWSNTASGTASSVSGGYNHTMSSDYGWMACGSYSCSDTGP